MTSKDAHNTRPFFSPMQEGLDTPLQLSMGTNSETLDGEKQLEMHKTEPL